MYNRTLNSFLEQNRPRGKHDAAIAINRAGFSLHLLATSKVFSVSLGARRLEVRRDSAHNERLSTIPGLLDFFKVNHAEDSVRKSQIFYLTFSNWDSTGARSVSSSSSRPRPSRLRQPIRGLLNPSQSRPLQPILPSGFCNTILASPDDAPAEMPR